MKTWLFLWVCSAAFAFETVEDQANLPLLNPDLAERETAKIRLDNGMEILLISDMGADKAAATVSVGVGSWSDPPEYPGMAHFCEHMLFMGTEKYPDTNEFFTQISNYDGIANAFTASDRTVYMFSSRLEGFASLFDRFAHFFIDPLFNASNILREMHAVDQEFALQKEHDGWREYMVFKETGNPEHPHHLFSTGNSKTLSKIPPSALKTWHQKHYGARQMRAALYAPLSLAVLTEMVQEAFQAVPVLPDVVKTFDQPITSSKQWGSLIAIQPIQHRNAISLLWELPPHLCDDDSKSAALVAFVLKRGQPQSVYEKLKKEQLIDAMYVTLNDQAGKHHILFEVGMELSQKGMVQKERVIERVFQAFAGLRETSIPNTLFQEMQTLAQLDYQYQTRIDAFQYISAIGRDLSNENFSTYPRKSLLASHYDPGKMVEVLRCLTPERCVITQLSPIEMEYERKEKWLQVPYSIHPIPAHWSKMWKEAKPQSDIQVGDPNPFVPEQLERVTDAGLGTVPVRFANSDLGLAYYIRCGEYQNPEAVIHLRLLTPQIQPNPKSQVLVSLYLDHLTDQLHPILSAASSAGLNADFRLDKSRIHLEVSGLSEKAPLLLQKILRQMPGNPPTQPQFDLYVARHLKEYANGSKELAAKQAKELLSALINPDQVTKREKLVALSEIAYEDLLDFHKHLFDTTYVEALFSGNLSLKTAESAWLDVLHVLGKNPFPKDQHPEARTLRLVAEAGPVAIREKIGGQGNAALLLIDEGEFTFERRAAQEILAAAIQESFFNTLRTKQKTGYIAQSQEAEFERHLYQSFLVQSNTHQPEDLLHRFELFLEEYLQDLSQNVSEKRFETLQQSAIASLQHRYRNLQEKSALWDKLAFDEKGDFSFVDQRIQGLQDLTYEPFKKFAEESLARTNRKRLAILYEGKLSAPFVYTTKTLREIAEVVTYASRPSEELRREIRE